MNRRKKLSMLVVAITTAGATAMTPLAAQADDAEQPTTRELLDQCDNGTDKCVFHPSGQPVDSMGDAHQVGDSAFNCTKDLQRSTVGWSDTTGETNTVGVSMKAQYGFTKLFSVTIEASYSHAWESSHTEQQQTNVEVKPNEVGWITREAAMQEVNGTYEMHFEDEFYGHRIWYVPFTAKGPKADAPSTKTQHTRKMTKKEKQEHCG
ncbi:DUF4148 domain-containing protein [Streptomyces sp. HNM0575]|uniref:DUF4148 domain-containing protein n=1 Tax=Streptomyces sp. HNM0575 TaxID=2716338 RepID=UPI00145D6F0B|nr:DUF4148 domain-containing protein [Streptomyces sp. HNM0575]NLU74834.1 DUF4148 domain-containing protein [Streptomyces sp. HNM0575]